MNASTKLALAFFCLALLGASMISVDMWPHYRAAAVVCGFLIFMIGICGFGLLLKGRDE
jgi:hypothetical protein